MENKILFINSCTRPNSRTKELAENFFGINDISFYSAEGLDVIGADIEGIMAEAKKKITSEL